MTSVETEALFNYSSNYIVAFREEGGGREHENEHARISDAGNN